MSCDSCDSCHTATSVCLGEATKCPHTPGPFREMMAPLSMCSKPLGGSHSQPRGAASVPTPNSPTVWLEVTFQLVPVDPDPLSPPRPSPTAHVSPSCLHPHSCHPTEQDRGHGSSYGYVTCPVPTVPMAYLNFSPRESDNRVPIEPDSQVRRGS